MSSLEVTVSKIKSWLIAARPKTLTAGLIPILVSSCLAYGTLREVHIWLSLAALLGAICIQVGTNLVNDAKDFQKGADTSERLGPVRVTQSGLLSSYQVMAGALLIFSIAFCVLLPLVLHSGWPLLLIILVSICCGYLYTAGPYPLAYVGLGDLFVLIFFGLVSTGAVYYVQTGAISGIPLLAGLQIGLFSVVLIAINNLRDIYQDSKADKKTLAVRFGKEFARKEIAFCLFLPYLLNALWIGVGFPLASFLPLVTLPLAIRINGIVSKEEPGPIYNQFLGQAALLHLSFGTLLSLGFLL